jgi:endo-1,4-beta-xylanase
LGFNVTTTINRSKVELVKFLILLVAAVASPLLRGPASDLSGEAGLGRLQSMKKAYSITLTFIFALAIPARGVEQPQAPSSLCRNYLHFFPIGAAVDSVSFRTHTDLLKIHFNCIVRENEMKFECTERTEGVFEFARADSIVDFAVANHMKIRGHCLVWYNQTPGWVFAIDSTLGDARKKGVLLRRMKRHITNVVGHFKGKVYAWNVVNEGIAVNTGAGDDAGADLSKTVSYGYRKSPWYRICGPDYIAEAFKCAHEADSGARLFYSDFYNN